MANDNGLTKEQFITQYGYDPEPDAVSEPPKTKAPSYSAWQIPRDLATGAATAFTDVYGLYDIAPAAARAGYNWATGGEGGFSGKMLERLLKPEASVEIQKHLEGKLNEWGQADPDLNEEERQQLLGQYYKTRAYEDFINSQKTHAASVAAEWKSGVRRFFGDTRTEEERSWANDLGEIAGGSLIGGPSGLGTKLAGTAMGQAVARSALNNVMTRGTLRVAEALTPVTMPYSKTNVMLNFGVGGAVDTALKAATGKESLITDGSDPKEALLDGEDQPGVGTAATIAIATGATAALAMALRGRLKVDLSQTAAGANLPPSGIPAGMPQPRGGPIANAADAIVTPPRGNQGIAAGPDIPSEPQPALPIIAKNEGFQTRVNNALNDEFAVPRKIMEWVRGTDVAKSMDIMFSDLTGARLIDKATKEADRLVGRIMEIKATLTPEAQDILNTRLHHLGVWGKRQLLDFQISEEITELTKNIRNTQRRSPNAPALADMQKRLADLNDELTRHRTYAPEHRAWMQEVSAGDSINAKLDFDNATDAVTVEIRDLLKAAGRESLDLIVKSGKMTRQYADHLHQLNPYHIHMIKDPLEGAVGWHRVWKGMQYRARQGFRTAPEDAGKVNPLQQAPIYALRDTVPKTAADPRVNNALDPVTSLHDYVRQMYIDYGHTTMRNTYLGNILYNGRNPSALMQGNHADVWFHPQESNRSWFTAAQIRSDPAIRAMLEDSRYVPRSIGGRTQFVRLGDTEIAAALRQYSPTWTGMMKIAAWSGRLAKSHTTGVFAPLFAFTNAYMDAFMAVARQSNRAFGSLTTAAFKYLPEAQAKRINAIAIDPTALIMMHVYGAKAIGQIAAYHMAPRMAKTLAQVPGINGFAQVIGHQNFQTMVRRMIDATMNSHMVYLMDRGAVHSSSFSPGDIGKSQMAVDDFKLGASIVPEQLRPAWLAYVDILNAVHSMPKLMFYSQNYSILKRKYGGNIPQKEIDKLVDETANMSGNMARKPGWEGARKADAIFPYLQQMRAGTFYLLKNLTQDWENAKFVQARLATLVMGVGAGHWIMMNWDEDAKNYWRNLPTWERYRVAITPTLQTAMAWARGENVKFSPDKVWMLPLAPDIAPVVAGSVYMMQQMGLVPSDAMPTPVGDDVPRVLMDAMTPMMPPLAQAALSTAGMKLDPQGADVRGGKWIRDTASAFRKGPAAEAASNLGEVTTSQAYLLSALFGANGAALQMALDVGMHAMKYHPELNQTGEVTQKANPEFMTGLGAALGTGLQAATERKKDVFPLWQRQEKYYKTTPAWEHAMEARTHIESIVGMRDEVGKSSVAARVSAGEKGGMPAPSLQDQTLISIAQEVYNFNSPRGDLGRLKTEYTELAKQQRAFEVQYNKPYAWRKEQVNRTVRKMQDNMQQQQLAIMWLEGDIADNYGMVLQPLMQGRDITMETLDDVMRMARGRPAAIQPVTNPQANAPLSVPARNVRR